MTPRLAVIVVTHNSAGEIGPCLSSLRSEARPAELELIVVDAGSDDGTPDLIERDFEDVTVARVPNRGYAAALNAGLQRTWAPYALLCNPDIELVSGDLFGLVDRLESEPGIGLAGARQLDAQGALIPTMRRRPSGARALAEALGCERLALTRRLGERVIEPDLYETEQRCDWVSGSFMLCRREALDAVNGLDEGFFLYSEEIDLALRITSAGYEVVHLPEVTIVHDEKRATGTDPAFEAQSVHSRLRFARKHLGRGDRLLLRAALVLRYALRLRRPAARRGLSAALGLAGPPFKPTANDRELSFAAGS